MLQAESQLCSPADDKPVPKQPGAASSSMGHVSQVPASGSVKSQKEPTPQGVLAEQVLP
jgi:hypothetical protein